jgi:hypothetical protein
VHFNVLPSSTSDLGNLRDHYAEGKIVEKEIYQRLQAE